MAASNGAVVSAASKPNGFFHCICWKGTSWQHDAQWWWGQRGKTGAVGEVFYRMQFYALIDHGSCCCPKAAMRHYPQSASIPYNRYVLLKLEILLSSMLIS
jgi:hypothetical protein